MNHYAHYQEQFERQKNLKALAYTLLFCGILCLIFFYLQWTLPQIPVPVADQGIEVNLGNSETGLGDIAPQVPGPPSSEQQQKVSTPPPSVTAPETKQNIQADENGDEPVNNSAAVVKHTLPKPIIHPIPHPKKQVTPIVTPPTPKPAKPKAVYGGAKSNTNGGNNADNFNNIRNQGIAGGKGDQGSPNGNPNSDSYKGTGGTGNSGVTIRNGLDGRRFIRYPTFEDEFNENAKVAVDITVDAAGTVVSATINPRGTTTTNLNIRSIAMRKARTLKLNSGKDDEQTGTIVFDFKLHN